MRGTGVILNLALILLAACTVVTTSAPPVTPLPTPVPSPTPLTTGDEAAFARQRERMVLETIERRGITDEDVLHAMRAVPRHLFVPENEQDYAYGDHPLPIGYGQTISQPYIVALMTELLELQEGDKVLEIGTGSGYQAAVLAKSTASRGTATMAGPSTAPLTSSSSLPPPITCHSCWWTNWLTEDGWWYPSDRRAATRRCGSS